MMLFSATFDDKVMKFAETIIPDPIILRLKREEESLDNIKQYFVTCSNEDDKFRALANIYSVISIGQAMVFCRVSQHINYLLVNLYECRTSVQPYTPELLHNEHQPRS